MSSFTQWSHSSLGLFEKCAYAAKLRYVDRIKTPQGDAAARGEAVHSQAEAFIRGDTDVLDPVLTPFSQEITLMRQWYAKGAVQLEQNWGYRDDWSPIPVDEFTWQHPELWHVSKLDVFLRASATQALVGDWKTGKKAGNEIKHAEQGQLYAVAAFCRFDELEEVTVEFYYPDVEDLSTKTYTRHELGRLLPSWTRRGAIMMTSTQFPPRANMYNCKWCDFAPDRGGQCEYGYTVAKQRAA
jgi:hypothetical protein